MRVKPRTLGVLLAILFATLIVAALWAWARQPGVGELARAFVAIAETGEFDARARIGIKKWIKPIGYLIVGPHDVETAAMIRSHFAFLEASARIKIDAATQLSHAQSMYLQRPDLIDLDRDEERFEWLFHFGAVTDTSSRPNFIVYFGPKWDLVEKAEALDLTGAIKARVADDRSPCFGLLFFYQSGFRIHGAFIMIRSDLEPRVLRRCIVEELTQSMGIANDIKGSDITLFDDHYPIRRTELTPYDVMFLRVLYDPRMTLGLKGEPLLQLSRQLIAEELRR